MGKGYSSIPENGGGSSQAQENDPFIIKEPTFIKRTELFIRRHFYHIIMIIIILIILIILAISTLIPDAPLFPNDQYPSTVKSGVSEYTMNQGRAKCNALLTRPKQKNLPNSSRVTNPRSVSTQPPILIKNAIVWDGQGEILNNVDIYIEKGIIRKVAKDIQVNEHTKVIDAAGHVVGPGLVDMHRYKDFFYITIMKLLNHNINFIKKKVI